MKIKYSEYINAVAEFENLTVSEAEAFEKVRMKTYGINYHDYDDSIAKCLEAFTFGLIVNDT